MSSFCSVLVLRRRLSKYLLKTTKKHGEKNLPRKDHVRFNKIYTWYEYAFLTILTHVAMHCYFYSRGVDRHDDVVFSSIRRECVAAPSQFAIQIRRIFKHIKCVFAPGFTTVSLVHGRQLAPCFWEGIRPWTNTFLMFLKGYSSMDEYLPHVFDRVFVRRTNTCPMFLRGYSSIDEIDEYLSHKPSTKPTNTTTYSYSYRPACAV